MGVEDPNGALIVGTVMPGASQHAITRDNQLLGSVSGEHAELLLALLNYIVDQESEKADLARDTLEKYRELNVLYDLSEKIGASLGVQGIAKVAVGEAQRLIKTGCGFLLLYDPANALFRPLEGEEMLGGSVGMGDGILGCIAQQARGEIINDVQIDSRQGPAEARLQALLATPLISGGMVLGILGNASTEPAGYSAADLKLLTAIASQVGPAIDSALQYEQAVREAEERERRLEQQLAELRIEIDVARQSRQVAAIVETDYFQRLRQEASELRRDLK
jgi:GAF domain-containing protein